MKRFGLTRNLEARPKKGSQIRRLGQLDGRPRDADCARVRRSLDLLPSSLNVLGFETKIDPRERDDLRAGWQEGVGGNGQDRGGDVVWTLGCTR